MGIAPLKYAELLALLEALAERPAVTLKLCPLLGPIADI